ncbi:hypothetical protein V9J44_001492 [Vibrio cholerae]|uniref:Uncharacterized protein n=1 Tax=Citrobacter freundii TaxID=546 RepID=A0A0K2S389_CITFR|nr:MULTISPECIES: hypothetical protein [Gammaproteobacteria]EGQ7672258.1 hypothetical protein [Vibrio cholerae]ELF3151645.1 hypothetical protein [Vibrio cholerae]ELH5115293.1 hypothetical protein [Vibrio cholerae]BAS21574.1 hypothetical protein [Citrobacter freundii]
MSEQERQPPQGAKIKTMPCIAGIPLLSALLIGAGLFIGPAWGVAAFILHIAIKRHIYREYRELPYPMPTSSRAMDQLNVLLVKGIPEDFFQQLEAARDSGVSVQITCPKKHRLLQMSLNRYANRVGCYPQFREGDEIAIAVTEPRPRSAGAGKSLPNIQDLKSPEDSHVLCEPEQPVEIQKDKRKIILD